MKKHIYILFICLCNITLSQNTFITKEESDKYRQFNFTEENQWDSLQTVLTGVVHKKETQKSSSVKSSCVLNKRVFGFHPYWMGSVYINYKWNLLSDLCYFDYTVEPTTGNNTNASFAWLTSAAVTTAKNNNVNISFCVTLFASHATFLTSTTAKQQLTANVISLLKGRGAKSVNIDFEGMSSTNKNNFTAFMTGFCNAVHDSIPGSEVSIDLPAVDWNGVIDVWALLPYVDLFIIMGYDYYWSGSTVAGPTDPLYNFESGYNYTLSKSMTYYLNKGIAPSKLILALPYYGRIWETNSDTLYSATTGNYSSAIYFNAVKTNSNGYYSNKKWSSKSFTPYYAYQVSTNWRQCFMNDSSSLSARCEMTNVRGIGGIGIWALGYDNGYTDYWNVLQNKFSSCANPVCNDTLYDLGGSERDYYDREKFFYVLNGDGNQKISLSFSEFNVEANYDTLWIYNGDTITAPLIGAYTGTNSPGTVTSSGTSLSLRFKSDGATVRTGWKAVLSCMPLSTGFDIDENGFLIKSFPNPVKDEFYITIESSTEIVRAEMCDIIGRSQTVKFEKANTATYKFNVSSTDFSKGIYLLRLYTNHNQVYSTKIVVGAN